MSQATFPDTLRCPGFPEQGLPPAASVRGIKGVNPQRRPESRLLGRRIGAEPGADPPKLVDDQPCWREKGIGFRSSDPLWFVHKEAPTATAKILYKSSAWGCLSAQKIIESPFARVQNKCGNQVDVVKEKRPAIPDGAGRGLFCWSEPGWCFL